MVVHVARRARASGAAAVIVATDHDAIAAAVEQHGFEAELTSSAHPSGTDRIAEVARRRGWPAAHIVVNVQGDEPLIEPALIARVAKAASDDAGAAIATLCCPLTDIEQFMDPNVVKVVRDERGYALYFSRAAIPYPRDALRASPPRLPAGLPAYRHIGLYAYRCGFLQQYSALAPTALERFEALEQLRALGHGLRIAVAVAEHAPHAGVDTEADLARVRRHFEHGMPAP